jgi:hypothetical protein
VNNTTIIRWLDGVLEDELLADNNSWQLAAPYVSAMKKAPQGAFYLSRETSG